MDQNPTQRTDKPSKGSLTVPHIYVVSFLEEPWKRIRVIEHCNQRGLPMTLVDGVNGMNLGLKSMNPFDIDQHGKEHFVHHSQIGRTISHRIALGVALASEESSFIIAEDDVWFPEDFPEQWGALHDNLPPDATMVQLSYLEDNLGYSLQNDRIAKTIPFPFCTTATWWTAAAAKKACQTLWAFDRPFDIMLIQRVYPYMSHYVARPRIVKRWEENNK